jgi:anti-sigma factor RsiW
MNTHDTKHTAFALGELSPAERAEIERELSADPELNAEIAEIREMAGILKKELAAEPAGTLAEHQRWAIIRAATPARPPAANERDVVQPGWWQRAGVWQVVAACAVFGFGVYAISQQLTLPSKQGLSGDGRSGDIIVPTPTNIVVPPLQDGPDTVSPGDSKMASGQQPVPLTSNPHGANASVFNTNELNAVAISEAVKKITKEVEAIREGSSFAEFREKFNPVTGTSNSYSLKKMPALRVDVEFGGADGQTYAYPPPDSAAIRKISKPYLSTK